MKYRPLDLSFIAAKSSPERESVRNTAAMIMANAGWSKPSQATLNEIAKANKEAKKAAKAATHQSPLSSFFDLLSTPLYGVANAMDEALAGHQSDPNDSVVEDITKTVGGVFTGAARGLGAGLRGATGLVDILPGIDINDEWQSDPTDKTHFSDVAIRRTTGMATGDAMKPGNWEKIKPLLDEANKKSLWDKTLFEIAIPDDLESPDAREKYFRNQMLTGIAVDIGGDPLNFALPGIGAINGGRRAAQSAAEITKGLEAAKNSGNAARVDAILKGLSTKPISPHRGEIKANFNEPSPVGIFDELPEAPVFAPKVSSIPAVNDHMGPAEQIAKWATSMGGWTYRAGSYLNYIHPNVSFNKTSEFLNAAKESGLHQNPEKFAPLVAEKIAEDIGNAAPISRIVDDVTPPPASGAPGIPVSEVSPFGAKEKVKTRKNIGLREIGQTEAVVMGGAKQREIGDQLYNFAATRKKGWIYEAAKILQSNPRVQWTKTEKLLEKANEVIKKTGDRGLTGLRSALRESINADVRATKIPLDVKPHAQTNFADEVRGASVAGGKIVSEAQGSVKMKPSDARLVNKVVRKFEKEILHTGRAPGTGDGLARAIASGRNARYSGPQQVRMWNQITSNLKYANPKKFDKTVQLLRAVENYFITKGAIPHSSAKLSESVPIRLSDVAEAIGPQAMGKTHAFITGILRGDPKALAQLTDEQIEALRQLRAKEAVAAAPATKKGIESGRGLIEEISQAKLSAGRSKDLINEAIKTGKLTTARLGGGDAGAHVTGEYLSNLAGRGDSIEKILLSHKLNTEAWLGTVGKSTTASKGLSKAGRVSSGAINDPKFVRSVTSAIKNAADLPSPASLGKISGPAAMVREWLGARFNAAYGVQDMRPIFLREQSSAMSTTGRRAKLLNNLAREYDPRDVDLWHEAFRAAQQNGVSSGRVAGLQSEIAKVMENLFGGTGLRSGAIADSTVVGRNRLLMDELNSNLRRFGLPEYQFQASKIKDAAGVEHDFSKGMDWMKSWEAWDVKDPYKFLHKVQNAIQHTVHEKNMLDEIISRFASHVKSGDVKYGVNHPRLKGYFFTEEGARQAQIFVRGLEEISTPNSKAMQHFDHVLSKLKASLTIYIPGHHWTNLIGDVYFNWIAGVNKPVRYDQATKVMLAQKGRYGDFASFDKLTGPKALEQAIARSVLDESSGLALPVAGNKTIITMQNGTKLTADMIYTAAFREGILPSARVLEEVGADVTNVLDKFRPLGGRGQRAVHSVSEVRDHIPRLAQFIDGLAKSKAGFLDAASESARAVRKWHPDGIDLTKFERNFMKRVFPFYSWTRKAIPLAIESAVFAGPKVMAYPRIMEAIALSNGINPTDQTTNPFPADQMFPDWVRDRGIGPIMGAAGSYRVINPSTPVLDIMSMLGHPGQTGVDMLNPMMKVPLETMQGQTLGRNVPIGTTNEEWIDYAAKQIPVVSQAGRASGQFGVSESTKAEGFPNYTNILNMLTGAKMVDTGKYQKSAQFDLRDYFRKKADQQFR